MNRTLSELISSVSEKYQDDPMVIDLISKIESVQGFMGDISEPGKVQCAQDILFDQKPTHNIYQQVSRSQFFSSANA